jgi:hypothetical protein
MAIAHTTASRSSPWSGFLNGLLVGKAKIDESLHG